MFDPIWFFLQVTKKIPGCWPADLAAIECLKFLVDFKWKNGVFVLAYSSSSKSLVSRTDIKA